MWFLVFGAQRLVKFQWIPGVCRISVLDKVFGPSLPIAYRSRAVHEVEIDSSQFLDRSIWALEFYGIVALGPSIIRGKILFW